MNLTKGMASSEFMTTIMAGLLPLATDLSDGKFLAICIVAAAYAISRGLAKKATS